jgi:outer membrane biosynthesis protein TonB
VFERSPGDFSSIPEIPVAALVGPADELGQAQTHPNPNADVEIAGARAASRGGGAPEAGTTSFTERRDPTHDVPIRHELWNGGRDYRSAHEATAPTAASPEAIHRDRDHDIADRARTTTTASAGGERPSTGQATGHADGVATGADPHAPAAGATAPASRDGAIRPNPTAPLVEPGARATDTPERAPAATDNTGAAASSRETKPGPFEITPPATGGTARSGVAGAPAPGQTTTGSGTGTAATMWGAQRGNRDVGIVAAPQDPYFRTLFARLEKAIVFPKDLALDLRSGKPTAEMVLRADGTIGRTAIVITSGLAGFDRELLRAIGTLGRLPAPPAALLEGRTEIRVTIEWAFNPGILR